MRAQAPLRSARAAALGLLLALFAPPAPALDMVVGDGTVLDVGFDLQGNGLSPTETTAASLAVPLYTERDLDVAGSARAWDALAAAEVDRFRGGNPPEPRSLLDATASGRGRDDTAGRFGVAHPRGAFPFDRLVAVGARGTIEPGTSAIPQPKPGVLTGLGLVGLAFYGRRRASRR